MYNIYRYIYIYIYNILYIVSTSTCLNALSSGRLNLVLGLDNKLYKMKGTYIKIMYNSVY